VSQSTPIYVFRSLHFAKSETTVTAAPIELVVSVFGGGGLKGEQGLETSFGGSAYYRNEATDEAFLAVWGTRNGSRFRRQLAESGATLQTLSSEPPARLVFHNSGQKGQRPKVR
jgi:hypothetical protein